MWCNQIFSLINNKKIQNIIVCDNYETARMIAIANYGMDATAVDTTYYPVAIGDTYLDGVFYRGDSTIDKVPTEAEEIKELRTANDQLTTQLVAAQEFVVTLEELTVEHEYKLIQLDLGI